MLGLFSEVKTKPKTCYLPPDTIHIFVLGDEDEDDDDDENSTMKFAREKIDGHPGKGRSIRVICRVNQDPRFSIGSAVACP